MPVLKTIDIGIRSIISVAFRVLLMLYSISILIVNNNYFEWYFYVSIFVMYIIVFYLLFKKSRIWSFFRLVNDFVFLGIILFGKELENLHTITLLILPITNSLNHSTKKRDFGFPIHLYLLVLISLYILRGGIFRWTDLVSIIGLSMVNFFLQVRTAVVLFNNSLYDAIDDFYEENLKIGGTYILLRKVKERICQETAFIKYFFQPKQIVCFRIKHESLAVESGTDIVITYSIPEERKFIGELRVSKIINNYGVTINNKDITKNIFILVNSVKTDYVFFIEVGTVKGINLSFLYAEKILKPLFAKIAKVIEVEKELRNERKLYLEKMKSKMEFVDSTIKAIHFLNNKLSPITNYFAMVREYDNIAIQDSSKEALFEIISKEKDSAINNIGSITEKTRKVLEKSSNPYFIPDTEKMSLRKVFSIIRRIWDERFISKDVFEVYWTENILESKIACNTDALEYVIDEIIENIHKHAESSHKVLFEIQNDSPVIVFRDTFKKGIQIDNLVRIADDFSREGLSELMRRNSHGLSLIKQYLIQMNMGHHMIIDEDMRTFQITILLKTIST